MTAAIVRTRSRLLSSAPPPSPIATAKGLRSAAVDDRLLSEILEKSLRIPDLTLPESHFPATKIPRPIPAEIDLSSLLNGDGGGESVHRLLESVATLGVFQIVGHGISVSEIGEVFDGSGLAFRVPKRKKSDLRRYFGERYGSREDLYWFRSGKEIEMLPLARDIEADTCRALRENIAKLSAKLESVADNVGRVLSQHTRKQERKRIQEPESVLCIHKYSSSSDIQHENPSLDGQSENDEVPSYALIFHLSDRDLEFHIRSQKGSFSFSASAGAIIVTIGEQLGEWSQREFKSVVGEPIFEIGTDANPSFSLRFMSSPSSLNHKLDHAAKTISLMDQMLITLTVLLIYILFTYMSGKLAQS